jgi:hypothetical protein
MAVHRQDIHRDPVTVRYTDAGDGCVTAQIAEQPAAISKWRTREEAYANVIDALCDLRRTPTDRHHSPRSRPGRRIVGSAMAVRTASR